jgi:hypothetical protein
MERKNLWPNTRDYADVCRTVGLRNEVKPITTHINTRPVVLIMMFCRDLNTLCPDERTRIPLFRTVD